MRNSTCIHSGHLAQVTEDPKDWKLMFDPFCVCYSWQMAEITDHAHYVRWLFCPTAIW